MPPTGTDAAIDAAINKFDNPTGDNDATNKGADNTQSTEKTTPKRTEGDANQGGDAGGKSTDSDTKTAPEDEGGYLAGDEPEDYDRSVDAPLDEDKPQVTSTDATKTPPGMSPEQAYIYEGLPTIVARGVINGKPQAIQVKVAQQLPDDFAFASKRDELMFNQAVAEQVQAARDLQGQFKQQEMTKTTEKFERDENNAIQADIRSLQQAGDIPRFTLSPSDPKFDDTPGAKQVQEVLDLYNKENEDFRAGKTLYRVSFKQAYRLYKAEASAKTADESQNQEDKARKDVTRKTAPGASTTPTELTKPRVAPNTSTRDLLERIELMDL